MKKRSIVLVFLLLLCMNLFVSNVHAETLSAQGLNISSQLLENEVNIPERLQFFAKILFGISGDRQISISELIVLIGFWAIILILLSESLGFASLFDNKILNLVVAGVFTCLVSLTGALREIAVFYFGLVERIKVFGGSSVFQLIFSLIIIALLFFGIRFLFGRIRGDARIEENERIGMKIGVASGKLRK